MHVIIEHFYLMQMPGMLDYFGWCTWDAFYHDVNPQGIRDGLKRLIWSLFVFNAFDFC